MKAKGILTWCIVAAVTVCTCGAVPARQSAEPEVKFRNDYYNIRRAEHDRKPVREGAVVFLGNSITEQGWWSVLFRHGNIVNRGIGGDNTYGMLDRLPDILASRPSKIFIMAGINDLSAGRSVDAVYANIARMADMTGEQAPGCRIYIQSVLPVNSAKLVYKNYECGEQIAELNRRLEQLCEDTGAVWVDVASALSDTDGQLKAEFTKDGIHLHPEGYMVWAGYLKKNKYLK